jgi:hypothetical protein
MKAKSPKIGRPLFDGKNVEIILQKLEQMFAMGGSDEEACLYAGISTSALYEYQKKDPEFLERKGMLKLTPMMKARKTVIDSLSSDVDMAWKFLQKKRPEEFGDRAQPAPTLLPKFNFSDIAKQRLGKWRPDLDPK